MRPHDRSDDPRRAARLRLRKPSRDGPPPRVQAANALLVRSEVRRGGLEHSTSLIDRVLEFEAIRRTTVAPRRVDPRFPRAPPRVERPQSPVSVGHPRAVTNHTLRVDRYGLGTGLLVHLSQAGTGSLPGCVGAGAGGGVGRFSGSGSRAGSGSLSGSTMIGIDSPGSPMPDTLPAFTAFFRLADSLSEVAADGG